MLLDFADNLHVVADVTVSHEANHTHMILSVGRIHGRFDGFHHLCATAALTSFEKRLRLRQIFFRGRYRFRKKNVFIT